MILDEIMDETYTRMPTAEENNSYEGLYWDSCGSVTTLIY